MDNERPRVVKIHDMKVDRDYMLWLRDIKLRYRNAQIKAAVKVNAEQLLFNWQLGRDLVERKAEEKWGAGVVEQLSLDLQAAFPNSKGFGVTNLWYMKRWYLFYSPVLQKLQQLVEEIPSILTRIPWGHHIAIIAKCKSLEEALFYISRSATEGWSRNTLMNSIKADLYHTSGGAATTFANTLPSPQNELAQAITKDTYDFGFLSLEKGYKEEALESELEAHLTRFLLELGRGFAYLGRQQQVIVGGKTRKLDMLFFHIPLNCYVVIELKTVPFEPEFAGKLNYYVNIIDDLIKQPNHNPTIGLLICSNKDDTDVRYSFKGLQTPIGVSTYSNVHLKEIQEQLPSVEELKNRIRLLEEELSVK